MLASAVYMWYNFNNGQPLVRARPTIFAGIRANGVGAASVRSYARWAKGSSENPPPAWPSYPARAIVPENIPQFFGGGWHHAKSGEYVAGHSGAYGNARFVGCLRSFFVVH